jgi:hypothetical protein
MKGRMIEAQAMVSCHHAICPRQPSQGGPSEAMSIDGLILRVEEAIERVTRFL